eukprot:1161529-Pelagomonas_calceolata.AAC.18
MGTAGGVPVVLLRNWSQEIESTNSLHTILDGWTSLHAVCLKLRSSLRCKRALVLRVLKKSVDSMVGIRMTCTACRARESCSGCFPEPQCSLRADL